MKQSDFSCRKALATGTDHFLGLLQWLLIRLKSESRLIIAV